VPLPVEKSREHRRIPVPELREMVASVTDLRARALIAMQLKLGLRAGEVANIRLDDLGMDGAEAAAHHPVLGSHDRLTDHEQTLYVPSKAEREGNKSTRPRLLPLDGELRALLDRYLLVRPDNGEPWLFISRKSHIQLDARAVNEVWKEWFHPEYAGTEDHRPVTSHFGRHRFTTYWRVGQDLNRQLVKYMRGDRTGAYASHRGMDAYLHAYYEDIEALYRAGMYQLACLPDQP
jgi:integrase/recombinase XerD